MKSCLKTVDKWDTIKSDCSLHDLIKAIQKICVGHDDTNQDMYNVVQACKNMFLFRQDDTTSTEDYVRDFKSYWDTCEAYKAEPAYHPKLIKARAEEITTGPAPTPTDITDAEKQIREEFMAGLLISSANQKHFGILKRDLQNAYLKGQDDYPKTFEEAKRLLGNWKMPLTNTFVRATPRSDGVAFVQAAEEKTFAQAAEVKNQNTKQKKTNLKYL